MSTTATSDFAAAGLRHLQDAQLLHAQQRWPNTDHLSGVAAECGLKAILLDFLGGQKDKKDRPVHPNMPEKIGYYGHIDSLWGHLAATAHGRSGAQFAALIAASSPFGDWNVGERYSDGKHISEQRAAGHLSEAKKILAMHQLARSNGVLP
ncbi:hypothetical protein [Amycolatopsis solani]|uniref:hypothetical protein n=1 Tax=Amycolatopsis solani TaxID=3028615 RepID=UPI0025B00B63|nr:hypothetical protein [Amycolatopsis sp. MEP2-6]